MRDGLYGVSYRGIEAGFAVRDDEVIWCAPVLRRRLGYWLTVAQWENELPPNMTKGSPKGSRISTNGMGLVNNGELDG
jgi:hypothetical protein